MAAKAWRSQVAAVIAVLQLQVRLTIEGRMGYMLHGRDIAFEESQVILRVQFR